MGFAIWGKFWSQSPMDTEGGLYLPSDETLELFWVILDHPGIPRWWFDARSRWCWWLEIPVGRKWDCGSFHHRTHNGTKFKLKSCLFMKFPFNIFGPRLISCNWNCGKWNSEYGRDNWIWISEDVHQVFYRFLHFRSTYIHRNLVRVQQLDYKILKLTNFAFKGCTINKWDKCVKY